MRVFVSYGSEDKRVAETVGHSLRARRHRVFLDVTNIEASSNYEAAIESAIRHSQVFIFLISPHSVRPGSYALTELAIAQGKWPRPAKHVLPVMVTPTPRHEIPTYLGAVSILEPKGNLPAETAEAVGKLALWRGAKLIAIRIGVLLLACLLIGWFLLEADSKSRLVGLYRVSIGPNGGCPNPNRDITGKPFSQPKTLAMIKPLGGGRFSVLNECGIEGKMDVGTIDTQFFGQYVKLTLGKTVEILPQDQNLWTKVDRGALATLFESICYWTTGLICAHLDERKVYWIP